MMKKPITVKVAFLAITLAALLLPVSTGSGATGATASINAIIPTVEIDFSSEIALSGNGEYLLLQEDKAPSFNLSLYQVPSGFIGDVSPSWKTPFEGFNPSISDDGTRFVFREVNDIRFYYGSSSTEVPIYHFDEESVNQMVISDNGQYVGMLYEDIGGDEHVRFVSGDTPTIHWDKEMVGCQEIAVSNTGKILLRYANLTVECHDTAGIDWSIDPSSLGVVAIIQAMIADDGQHVLMYGVNGTNYAAWSYDGSGGFLNLVEYDDEITGIDITDNAAYVTVFDFGVISKNLIYKYSRDLATEHWQNGYNLYSDEIDAADDDSIVAYATVYNHILALDSSSGEVIFDYELGGDFIEMGISDDGTVLAVLSLDDTVTLFSIAHGNAGNSFWQNFIDTFTNLDNAFGLIVIAAASFGIGALVVKRRVRE